MENTLAKKVRTEMEITTGFGMAVVNFSIEFNKTMNRKTWTKNDRIALEALEEMVKQIKDKFE